MSWLPFAAGALVLVVIIVAWLTIDAASIRRVWERWRGRGPQVLPLRELEAAAHSDALRRRRELDWLIEEHLARDRRNSTDDTAQTLVAAAAVISALPADAPADAAPPPIEGGGGEFGGGGASGSWDSGSSSSDGGSSND